MSKLQLTGSSSRSDTIYFYRRDDPYFEFSNFSSHDVTTSSGLTYSTVEHFFQASKFLSNSPRPDLARTIHALPYPGAALKLATLNRSFQRPDWFSVNLEIMAEALYLKFTQHGELGELLEGTGERELREDSPVDYFWGVGKKGDGRNELGKALMRLRERLREEDKKKNVKDGDGIIEGKKASLKGIEGTDSDEAEASGVLDEDEWPALG